jgi:hypothetical protein
MIRFRTIEPETAAKADKAPAAAVPAQAPLPDAEAPSEVKPKGLIRKTPLRARKPEAGRLFQE